MTRRLNATEETTEQQIARIFDDNGQFREEILAEAVPPDEFVARIRRRLAADQ